MSKEVVTSTSGTDDILILSQDVAIGKNFASPQGGVWYECLAVPIRLRPGDSIRGRYAILDTPQNNVSIDPDEVAHYGLSSNLRKAQTRNDFLYGGALIPQAERGELIEVLRNSLAIAKIPGTEYLLEPILREHFGLSV